MRKIIDKILDWDWEMIILGTLGGIIILGVITLIVYIVLMVCGVVPMESESGNNSFFWFNMMTTVRNTTSVMR